VTLAALGWNDSLAQAFAPYAAEGCEPARVTLELKGYCEVTGETGARLGECSGKFIHSAKAPADYPAIGDWVAVTPQPGDPTRVAVQAVLPRRTKFSRRAAGEADTEEVPREITQVAPAVPVFVISAKTRRGLKALAPWLRPGQTIALLGSSGVGKSTLINRLMGGQVQFTQEVREADNKGRHTTTQRELLVTPDGVIIIDTPGMREIQPWEAGAGLAAAFDDVTAVAGRCKFRDCTHTVEPGCAVTAALADGSLEPARWQSYLRMLRATAHEVRRVDRPAAQQHRSQMKKLTKQLRRRVHEKSGEE
jgi:ribosome biogenesis GTPase